MPYNLKWFTINENLFSFFTSASVLSRLAARIYSSSLLTSREEIEESLVTIDKSSLLISNAYYVCSKDDLIENLIFLQIDETSSFRYLNDIVCIESLGKKERFCVIYKLYSAEKNEILNLTIFTAEAEPISTAQYVFSNCVWAEREIFEMHGVYFIDHNNLQKILTDYAFKGHPMRKDFPMTGYLEHFYSYHNNLIESVPVEFMQEYRVFDFYSNWVKKEVCETVNDNFAYGEEFF